MRSVKVCIPLLLSAPRIRLIIPYLQLSLACGTENVLLTVAEAEKCEYEFTGTTPALCLPVDASEVRREEL
jgi:hypothetical protein